MLILSLLNKEVLLFLTKITISISTKPNIFLYAAQYFKKQKSKYAFINNSLIIF